VLYLISVLRTISGDYFRLEQLQRNVAKLYVAIFCFNSTHCVMTRGSSKRHNVGHCTGSWTTTVNPYFVPKYGLLCTVSTNSVQPGVGFFPAQPVYEMIAFAD
jgi:hypothetical protein